MTTRTRVKTVPAANGRHRYLIVSGTLPIIVSKSRYRTVGDAKSAGKIRALVLNHVAGPLHSQVRGLCIECLYHGAERRAVRLANADAPGVLCRACHAKLHHPSRKRQGAV